LSKTRTGETWTELFVPAAAAVSDVRGLTATERLFTLELKDGRPLDHEPGQFVQVSIFGFEEAPISVCSSQRPGEAAFQLCVRRTGRLTKAMHELRVGQEIGIRGPLGKGFPLGELAGKDILLIAGGIGLAPMRSLIQHCLGHAADYGTLTLLYGAKRPAEMLFRDELEQWRSGGRIDVRLIVDVGDAEWPGPVGLITELIGPLEVKAERTASVIVGPPVMYRPVISGLCDKGLSGERIFLSLERHMRCGVGKCGHCIIGASYGRGRPDEKTAAVLYCCIDGPVFSLAELTGVEGAF